MWPENVIARYLTVGGATVDLVPDETGVNAICRGCPNWSQRTSDDPALNGYSNRDWSTDRASKKAQAHAEKCRALPIPTA